MSTVSASSADVDPAVWRACAGGFVRIPAANSIVHYFPQGHAEQSFSPPVFSIHVSSRPSALCRVVAVRYFANSLTDEVYALIKLLPLPESDSCVTGAQEASLANGSLNGVSSDGDEVVSFAKILTPSDANNGGGFSVPRFCADSIFPPLNFAADPPVQNLIVRDAHGRVWEFRHIYRGTPRRHLLTTGWSKFVNSKKLIAGDSVVFISNKRSGELFVGIRRAVRTIAASDGKWNCSLGSIAWKTEADRANDCGRGEGDRFRDGRGRVSPDSVTEAAEMAMRGMVFEVVYYPTAGFPEFVVKAESVQQSTNVFWTAGMRVKMAMETEDSSRMTWFQGTVSSIAVPSNGPWRGSPWRMLQVKWDEPEALQNVKSVSPWQVEYVLPSPVLCSPFPSSKKFRGLDNSGFLSLGEGELYCPMNKVINSVEGPLSSSLTNYTSFPAGMQGARQDTKFVSTLSNSTYEGVNHMYVADSACTNMSPSCKTTFTEPNIGSSQSANLSSDSQSSVHFFGSNVIGKRGCISPSVSGITSFRLFGKIIYMKDRVEGECDVGGTADKDIPSGTTD